jgi:hypothetical protein
MSLSNTLNPFLATEPHHPFSTTESGNDHL